MLHVDVLHSAPAMLGLAVPAGHFARVVLASLESRVQLALTREQQTRTADAARAVQSRPGVAADTPAGRLAARGMTDVRTLLRE